MGRRWVEEAIDYNIRREVFKSVDIIGYRDSKGRGSREVIIFEGELRRILEERC